MQPPDSESGALLPLRLGNLAEPLLESASEFNRRTGIGWDKLRAREWLMRETGQRCPELLWKEGGGELRPRQMPDSFVLKHSLGCGRKWVYCLTRRGQRYYESLRRRWLTANDIRRLTRERANGSGAWFVEAYLGVPPRIPLDYKVYYVQGSTPYIIVIDRNPAGGLTYFDEALEPVRITDLFPAARDIPEVGLQTRSRMIQKHQVKLLTDAALEIGTRSGAPTLRVDLYFEDGVVSVGELTPTCGYLYCLEASPAAAQHFFPGYVGGSGEVIRQRAKDIRNLLMSARTAGHRLGYGDFLEQHDLVPEELAEEDFNRLMDH